MSNVNARRIEDILTNGITADHYIAGTNITISDNDDGTQTISASGGSGGTTDYGDLSNKPSINSVTLSGNKTTSDLGIDEVPDVTSTDSGKVLMASYSDSTGSYDWQSIEQVPNPVSGDLGKVLTAAGENVYGWADIPTPSVNEVPQVTSADRGKVLTAIYSGEAGSYLWYDLPKALKGSYSIPNSFNDRVDNIIYGGPNNVGLSDTFALYTVTDKVQTNGWQIAAAIGSSHKLYFQFKPSGQTFGNWIALDIDALSNYSAAPTAYTTPTYDTTYVNDTSPNTFGGYVVSNNICTVNLQLMLKSAIDSSFRTVATGLPKPRFQLWLGADAGKTTPGWFVINTSGEIKFAADGSSAYDVNIPRALNVSYLIDTST